MFYTNQLKTSLPWEKNKLSYLLTRQGRKGEKKKKIVGKKQKKIVVIK